MDWLTRPSASAVRPCRCLQTGRRRPQRHRRPPCRLVNHRSPMWLLLDDEATAAVVAAVVVADVVDFLANVVAAVDAVVAVQCHWILACLVRALLSTCH